MANIRERKNKKGEIISYQIRVHKGRDMNGKQLKPYICNWKIPEGMTQAKALKEVKKYATIFEKQCKDGVISSENVRFCEYADYVVNLKEKNGGKHKTIERYREILKRVNQEIGHLKLKEISGERLNQYYLKLSSKGANMRTGGGLAPKTIIEHHRLIHTIYSQAVKEGIVISNVANKSTPPRVEKKEAQAFSLDELNEIIECLEYVNPKWKLITHLLISTGARRGEIMGLKWCNIDLNNGILNIKTTLLYARDIGVYEDTTKTRQARYVKVSSYVVELLRDYMEEQQKLFTQSNMIWSPEVYCFLQDNLVNPMNPDCITKWLGKFYKKYNLAHINPHKFRHTQASILYAEGVDPVAISKRLGHNDVTTTQTIYTHLMSESQAKANDTIANVVYAKLENNKKENKELN